MGDTPPGIIVVFALYQLAWIAWVLDQRAAMVRLAAENAELRERERERESLIRSLGDSFERAIRARGH